MLTVMQPQQAPASNPYDFITDHGASPKKPLFGGGGMQQKLFVVVGGLAILTIVLVLAATLFGGQSSQDTYWKAIQQQAEITRVANIGAKSASNSETRNFAITVRQTMQSQQTDLYSLASDAGIEKIDNKKVAAGIDNETDSKLTNASQLNQFDETFTELMVEQLQGYQNTLKTIYESSRSQKNKEKLDSMYAQIQTLVRAQTSTSGSSEETPATN